MAFRPLLFPASILLVACTQAATVPRDAAIETFPGDAGTSADVVGGMGKNAIGKLCNVEADAGLNQVEYSGNAGECPSKLCLRPAMQYAAPMPALATGATCTSECAQDSDCEGEVRDPSNASDRRCQSGFTCAIPFVVGPLCCRKLCVCRDFLNGRVAQTPLACSGNGATSCAGTPSSEPATVVSGTSEETDIVLTLAPKRQLDMVFMIDNSPGMAPKQTKLSAQFPKLIEALKDPDGLLPDLRIAIIDSDLGTGGAYTSGPCGPKNGRLYGDQGRFQMIGATSCGVTSDAVLFLEHKSGSALNYKGDISTVFSCLAGNLGTLGCGQEHQLQAFEFALAAAGVGNESQQAAFLRPDAQLALVFLSDEDDCSAAVNDGMFGVRPGATDLTHEADSLRCYTRSHACNGKNLADDGPGYPTTHAFSTALSGCSARTDSCPNYTDESNASTDTSGPTKCSPLKSIRKLADHLKTLRSTPDQILVAGFFGLPLTEADAASAQYKIDLVPNPSAQDAALQNVYDAWPICYDPAHRPAAADFDANAAGWGATAGLRLSAFVDEFGSNGLKFSACQSDFGEAMTKIGSTLAARMQNFCVDARLLDSDVATPGLQPSCHVAYLTPTADPKSSKIAYVESSPMFPCPADAINGKVSADCWRIANVGTARCPGRGQWLEVLRTAEEIKAGPLPTATKALMQCQTCATSTRPSAAAGCND